MAYNRTKKDGTPAKPPGRKLDPNKPPKVRSPGYGKGRRGPRPHVWKCGPDESKHEMYTPWMRAKAQANFRNEGWDMSFEEYHAMWEPFWSQRGRGADDVCMSRKDYGKPWTVDNCMIVSRREHLKIQGGYRAAQGMKYYRRGKPGPKGPRKLQYAKLKVQ